LILLSNNSAAVSPSWRGAVSMVVKAGYYIRSILNDH
jgi:hypothetical protein